MRQRLVLVIALGLGFYFIGEWVTQLGTRLPSGWTGYAPLESSFPLEGFHPWVRLVIWLILIATWTSMSIVILSTKNLKSDGVD